MDNITKYGFSQVFGQRLELRMIYVAVIQNNIVSTRCAQKPLHFILILALKLHNRLDMSRIQQWMFLFKAITINIGDESTEAGMYTIGMYFSYSMRKMVWRAWDLILATVLIVVGVNLASDTTMPLQILAFVLLTQAPSLFYSLWIVLSALTFWFTKSDNNVTILQALLDAGRYPVTVYPLQLRILATFVVPIAVATTVSLQGLRGNLTISHSLIFIGIGIGSFLIASQVWKRGLKQYSGASS
jgi:ABC-2 family transporter